MGHIYAYSRFQRDCKEGESGTIYGKFVLMNMNSSDDECKFGLQGQTSCS